MKKFITVLTFTAFAALSFTSCQKEIANDVVPNDTVKMRIHASSSAVETKTVVSENQEGYYDINWSAGDQIEVLEFVDDVLTQRISSSALTADASEATFDVELREVSGDSFLYETVYPVDAYASLSSGDNPFYRLNLSDNQIYSDSSFDCAADVLISRPVHESEQPEELALEYKRIGSAARMVLKGITPGETITKVVFSTEEGKIAGYSKFDPTTAEFLGTYTASKNSIELTPASETTATGADVVWFRLYAITLKEGFKVVVTTDAATYTKDVDLATANRELAFNDGGLTKFNVAFAAENREANSSSQYVLVTDASSLSAGDIIRLGCVAKGKAAGAMGANSYFASVDATFKNGVLTSNNAIDIVLGGLEGAWTLTTSEGQITTSAAKAFKLDDGTSKTWTINIKDGVATITAGSYGSIQYNSGSPRFVNYTSTLTSIEIYRLDDGKQSQSLSFGETTEFTITVGDEFVAPQLSGNMTDVTYSSSDTNVATVDETSGAVLIVGEGTTIITANAAESSEYRAATASYTITVNAQGGDDNIVLSLDLSKSIDGWPTTNSTTLTNYKCKLNGIDYTFGLKNVKCNSGYLMLTSTAVLGLPAIEGKKLTKIVAKNSSGCSTSTKVGVSSSSSSATYIDGGAVQTWSTTSTEYTYNLTGTANNTVYYLYVTNKNAQIVTLTLTYE